MDLSLPHRLNGGPYIFGFLDDTNPEADLLKLGRIIEPESGVYGPLHYDSPVFTMHHYCWCGDPIACDYCCDDPLPNFHYKPTDLRVYWYKWILRDPSSNRECEPGEWAAIMAHCLDDARERTKAARFKRTHTAPWER